MTDTDEVTFTVTRRQAVTILTALRRSGGVSRRKIDPDFRPAPGRCDRNLAHVAECDELLAVIATVLGPP